MSRTQYYLLSIVFVICFITVITQSTYEDVGWEKIVNMIPENYELSEVLYTGDNADGIIRPCFERCQKSNCSAFYVDISQSTCSKVIINSEYFEPAQNSIIFQTIHIKVPEQCKTDKLWHVQRTLGAMLIDTSVTWLPDVMTRSQCYQRCLLAARPCKSAQFRTNDPFAINDVQGKCALLSLERGTKPQAYRASMYRDEYLETECHMLSNTDYCSYAEYKNMTLPYSDMKLNNFTDKQCEERCNAAKDGFICRAFTISYEQKVPVCLLHSDGTMDAGVSSLIKRDNVVYKERESCINLKVSCRNTSLNIELITPEPFFGRIYSSGYSETCNVQGYGGHKTLLELVLPEKQEIRRGNFACGILPAFAVGDDNKTRTAVWVTVVVQFNPIIQRLGDQSVRVGCTLDDDAVPYPRNVTIGSSFSFLDPNAGLPPVVGTVFNTTRSPILSMKMFNEDMSEVTTAELGQKLILKIEIIPSDGPYDIAAGHLVASSVSGQDSILLVDEMGCPTDPRIFSGFFKDPTDNKSLIASFTAFKFPDSCRVKFNVIVRFCLTKCELPICKNNITFLEKHRRAITSITPIYSNTTNNPDELKLESTLMVRDATIVADPLKSGKSLDTVIIAGEQPVDGLLCVNAALALGLLIFWLIIQILLTVTCVYIIRRYRKLARKAEEERADILVRHLYGIHGENFEIARRVRWADHNESSNS